MIATVVVNASKLARDDGYRFAQYYSSWARFKLQYLEYSINCVVIVVENVSNLSQKLTETTSYRCQKIKLFLSIFARYH